MPHARVLVAAFFDAVSSALSFVQAVTGTERSEKLETLQGMVLTRASLSELPDYFFGAEVRFKHSRWSVWITYGDREFDFNTLIQLHGQGTGDPYALWEWLRALDASPLPLMNSRGATRPEQVSQRVAEIGSSLQRCWTEITDPNPSVLERVQGARREWYQKQERDRLEHNRNNAIAAANSAFQQNDFERVVVLLEPIANLLTPAEQKKLQYARKRIAG